MSHDDFAFEPTPGLPAPLPRGETLLWQGTPDWKSFAIRAYHVRKVGVYFLALLACSVLYGVVNSHAVHDVLVSCVMLIVLGSIAMGVLATLAYFSSRSTVYSITSRRVLIRHGIAVPMTMDVPLKLIDGAALKVFDDGTGDIALAVPKNQRVGYLITWPHLRPGYLTRPQPSFRTVPGAARAADILSAALALDAGAGAAVTLDVGATTPARPTSLPPTGTRAVNPRSAATA